MDQATQARLDKEMNKVKVVLAINRQAIFFASIVMSMKTIWSEENSTAWTNGKVIAFNPTFFTQLTLEERVFVLCHEALHVVLKHLMRLGTKNLKLWQYATDYCINAMLIKAGFKMPSMGLYDPRFHDMSADQIYKILLQENFEPSPTEWEDLKEPTEPEAEQDIEIERILIRATTLARASKYGAGSIPEGIKILLDQMLNPRLPWYTILSRWMVQRLKTHNDWRKPNKRFFPKHHLPTRIGEGLKNIVVAFDASSSVYDHQFNIMVSELSGVLKQFKPEELTILVFNTRIVSEHKVRSVRELQAIEFKGRGGTDPECVFQWCDEHQADALLVFTDGEFNWRRDSLTTETIWIINDNPHFIPQFGKTVFYDT